MPIPPSDSDGWISVPAWLDSNGEPPLIADGRLDVAVHLADASIGPSAGWSLVASFQPGRATRAGSGYQYTLTLPIGPSTMPAGEVSTDGSHDVFTATVDETEHSD